MSETKHTPLPWRLGSPNVCCVKKHESHHLGPPDCEYTFQGWNDDDEYFGRFVSSKETQAEIIGSDEDGPMLSLSDAQLIVTSVNARPKVEELTKLARHVAYAAADLAGSGTVRNSLLAELLKVSREVEAALKI